MTSNSQKKTRHVGLSVGDNILVSIPEADRGRIAPCNVLATVMETLESDLYSGYKTWKNRQGIQQEPV